jgi:hypothetical protein
MTTVNNPVDLVRRPITPGPEMAALARFYPDVTWTGTIAAGGMGPDTPPMTATGQHPGRRRLARLSRAKTPRWP